MEVPVHRERNVQEVDLPRLCSPRNHLLSSVSVATSPAQFGRGEPDAAATNEALSCTARVNLALQDLADAPTKIISQRPLGGGPQR